MNSKINKIIGVIPARYESSRFPGKPLADICGKPMIWWVYQQCKKVTELNEIYVATDDLRIKEVCDTYNMKCIMTSISHNTHIHRVHEISELISSDYYVVICGDEPLIEIENIKCMIPRGISNDSYITCTCRYFTEPAEVIDPANTKVVTNPAEKCVFLSRSPIPFPYKTLNFKYKKLVGVECYNKKALDYFVSLPKGYLESIEDVTLQRFLENGIAITCKLIESDSLSVDTPKDLEIVREKISNNKIKNNGK